MITATGRSKDSKRNARHCHCLLQQGIDPVSVASVWPLLATCLRYAVFLFLLERMPREFGVIIQLKAWLCFFTITFGCFFFSPPHINIFSFGEIWSSRDVELIAVFWNMTSCSVVDIGIHGVIFQQIVNFIGICCAYRSQWPRGIRCVSAAARLPGLRVRITSGALTSLLSVVCCQIEVSASGWWLVQRSPTKFYWVWSWSHENEEALAL